MAPGKKERDDFLGTLKDPSYGRPVVLLITAPIGTVISMLIEKTGEKLNLIKLGHEKWAAYGTNTHIHLRDAYTTKEMEDYITELIHIEARHKGHIKIRDPNEVLIIRSAQYV